MKKRLIWLICICALLCALTACGKEKTPDIVLPEDSAPPKGEVVAPASPAPEPEPEPAPETSSAEPPVQSEEPSIPTTGQSGMLAAYEEILRELYNTNVSGPSFALYDVDLDGVEELIVQDTVGEVAGQWLKIYGYDDGKREAYIELEEFPNLFYYDNGVIEAGLSHNQGVAGDKLWPYYLYQFNRDTGVYEKIAMVDGWDKDLTDMFAGEAFPDAVDQDGDGFVYYVITEEGGYAPVYGEAMDGADYEAWRQTYLKGAFPAGPSFLPLVEEYISLQ